MHVHSFPPLVVPGATRLVLGSMPGKASLAAGEYYAHPRNLFWPLVGELLGLDGGASYAERCDGLTRAGVAVWDVLKTCTRASSLDSDIVPSSIVPNDLGGFLAEHRGIETVFFNGATAETIFDRHVRPTLRFELRTVRLPSTSPANASIPRDIKRERWRALLGG